MTFSFQISKDLNSRLTELSFIQKVIYDYKGIEGETTVIRSGVVMLYSHWQGFFDVTGDMIKNTFKGLKVDISSCKNELVRRNFFGVKPTLILTLKILALKKVIGKSTYFHELPIKFSTEDNLKYSIFKEIYVDKLCIDIKKIESNVDLLIKSSSTFPSEFLSNGELTQILKLDNNTIVTSPFTSYDDMLNNTVKVLLYLRNNISHGKKDLAISIEKYDYLYEIIKYIMLSYKDILIDYFDRQNYL